MEENVKNTGEKVQPLTTRLPRLISVLQLFNVKSKKDCSNTDSTVVPSSHASFRLRRVSNSDRTEGCRIYRLDRPTNQEAEPPSRRETGESLTPPKDEPILEHEMMKILGAVIVTSFLCVGMVDEITYELADAT